MSGNYVVHKILRRDITPDGIEIQLEDWGSYNTKEYPDLYGYTIAAYPISKGDTLFIRRGEKFRLSIGHNQYADYTGDKILKDYYDLLNGDKTLEDLVDHYDAMDKARYLMGFTY